MTLRSADHFLYGLDRVDVFQLDVGMKVLENAENLVPEGLADFFDARKIKRDVPELVQTGQNPFRLGAGNEYVVALLGQCDGDDGFVERIQAVNFRRILVENLLRVSR